jgi:ribose transport system substrate-binding protein
MLKNKKALVAVAGLLVTALAFAPVANAASSKKKVTTKKKAKTTKAVATKAPDTVAAPATTKAAPKKLKIAFVMGAESDPFFQAMKVGAEEEAKASNVELIWAGDPQNYGPDTQIPIVDQVLAQKPDGLVLIPTDPKALQASVAKAKAAGIAVSNVDTRVDDLTDVVSFITGDNKDGGAKAADLMAKTIGYKAGTKYKVVVGLTSATATTNVGRLDGFKAQVAAKYSDMEIVDVAYSGAKPDVANTNVANWLTKYPDLSGIFAIDGSNAEGAASALQAKGLAGKIALIGYDAYPDNVKKIQSGIFTGLVAQVPAAEAKQAIKDLVKYINSGKKLDGITREVVIPNFMLTKDSTPAEFKQYTYVAK